MYVVLLCIYYFSIFLSWLFGTITLEYINFYLAYRMTLTSIVPNVVLNPISNCFYIRYSVITSVICLITSVITSELVLKTLHGQ